MFKIKISFLLLILIFSVNVCANISISENDTSYARVLYNKFKQTKDINPALAKIYADSAILIFSNNNLAIDATDIIAETAVMLKNTANYSSALSYSLKAIKFYEIANNEAKVAKMNNNIGSIYYYLNNNDKAIEFYTKAIIIAEKIKYDDLKRAVYNNLSLVFSKKNDLKKALEYSKMSLNIAIQEKDSFNIAVCLTSLGDIYYYTQNFKEAKSNYNAAYTLFAYFESKSNQSIILNNLAEIEIVQKNYNQALINATKAYKISQDLQILDNLAWSAQLITKLNILLNNQNEALRFLDSFITKQEKLYTEENSSQIAQMQVTYDTEKNQKTIEILEKQAVIKNEKLKTQSFLLIGIILFAILLSALALLSYRNAKTKAKANAELEKRNLEIKNQKEEILQINEQLEIHTKQLRELDEYKSRFFANISHEFRTPLTIILGYTEQIIDSPIAEVYKNQLLLVKRQGFRLLKMIEQLLTIAKIEQGKLQLSLVKDDFMPFLRTVISSFQSFAEDKQLEIKTELHSDRLIMFYDKEKCETILYNLLSNAIKYTEAQGTIKVKSKVENNELIISVVDTGIGIIKEQLSHIFGYFYRTPNTKNIDGYGIGLSLTKELINIHKAKINVESKEGEGSCFSISLSLNENHYNNEDFDTNENKTELSILENVDLSKTIEKDNSKESSKNLPLLLLVEDNLDMRNYISSSLNKHFEIVLATNGQEGIDKAIQIMPDLIVSDVMMPEKDGKELTRTLKTDTRTSHIPIILLTALSSVENKIEGLETQADDYITKPFSVKELIARINNLLISRQKLREKFEKSITVNPSEVTVCSTDEVFLTQALAIVEKHIMDSDLDVEVLCNELNLSRPTLHRKLKSLTGQSATEFIRTIRLKRAASLITQNAGNMSEIAYSVGFNSLSYFTKSFKEYFGIAPTEYQNQNT